MNWAGRDVKESELSLKGIAQLVAILYIPRVVLLLPPLVGTPSIMGLFQLFCLEYCGSSRISASLVNTRA